MLRDHCVIRPIGAKAPIGLDDLHVVKAVVEDYSSSPKNSSNGECNQLFVSGASPVISVGGAGVEEGNADGPSGSIRKANTRNMSASCFDVGDQRGVSVPSTEIRKIVQCIG